MVVILLPASEMKYEGGTGPAWGGPAGLAPRLAQALQNSLTDAGLPSLSRLFGARGPLLQEAIALTRQLFTSPTRPALLRYRGVIYQTLDCSELPSSTELKIFIFSPLFGPLAAADLIPNYRLALGGHLPGFPSFGHYWRDTAQASIGALVPELVVNLLPASYRSFGIDQLELPQTLTVSSADAQGRQLSYASKVIKGALVRALLNSPEKDPIGTLTRVSVLGYRFDESHSSLKGALSRLHFRASL